MALFWLLSFQATAAGPCTPTRTTRADPCSSGVTSHSKVSRSGDGDRAEYDLSKSSTPVSWRNAISRNEKESIYEGRKWCENKFAKVGKKTTIFVTRSACYMNNFVKVLIHFGNIWNRRTILAYWQLFKLWKCIFGCTEFKTNI